VAIDRRRPLELGEHALEQGIVSARAARRVGGLVLAAVEALGFDCNHHNDTMADLAALLAANTLSGNGQEDRLQNGSFGQ
jgi:hypothetical protein